MYLWVDGGQADYQALVRAHASRPRDLNPERFRDDYEMLRYSLRSLETNAPWVRNVHLFTCRPQVPGWLRRDHPRLRIVHHDEVVTEPGVLPMFNSNVIESYLHRLPGLSEFFLYFNDDHFLGAPVQPADFYTADGRLKVLGTVCGERLRYRIHEHQWLSLGLLEHSPFLIERRVWAEMLEQAADEIAESRSHHFRQPDDLRCDRLYRWHLLTHDRKRVAPEPAWRYLRYSAFHKVKTNSARERIALARLAEKRPRFICLNDDQGDEPNPEVVSLVRNFLHQLWPTPSSFERPGS